jgi:hypothetical protein
MAEYIPEGREFYPTTREYSGSLTIIGKKFFTEEQLRKKINIKKIFLSDMTNILERGICRQIIQFRVNQDLTEKQKNKLKKLGLITFRIKQNYNEVDHHGYIKREYAKYKNISDSEKVRLWDIIRDKDGNEWEVAVMKNEPYYCGDCNDTHDQWEDIETYLFKTKEDAEKKYKSIKRKAA